MRLCDPGEALGQVWHILEVLEGSPAEVSQVAVSRSLRISKCVSTSTVQSAGTLVHVAYSMLDSHSFAFQGLVPYGDYVVGWTEGPLYTESEFYDLVEQVNDPFRHRLPSKLRAHRYLLNSISIRRCDSTSIQRI